MTGKIFINYRRGDDPGHTGRLFDRLQDVFPADQLFLDIDNIAPGLDFVRVLNEHVAECDVMLAVIGRTWIEARDAAGNRRLDDPDDFVRIEITSALNQGKRVIPVLVGDAPMPRSEDLPEALQPLARRNAVRLTYERFRADTQGLVKALQQSLDEIETARGKAEAERLAAEQRRLEEAEAARLAEEIAHKTQTEAEAREREAQQRHRHEAADKQRAAVERAFATARRANTAAAIEAFQSVYPDSHLVAEARELYAALLVREEVYRQAMASDDIARLKSFCTNYKHGADVSAVQLRLGALRPRPFKPAIIVPAALAAVAIVAALAFWAERKGVSTNPSASITANPLPPTAPQQQATASQTNTLPSTSSAPEFSADQIAWSLVKDTSDVAAIKRYVTQFPNSALRKNAEARITSLEVATAAKAAKVIPLPTEEDAWDLIKNSKEPDQFQRYLNEFPNSPHRADAEQIMAALTSAQKTAAAASAPDPHELTRSLQFELQRVGCFNGVVNGEFDDPTKAAWRHF
ncbi:MAG: toll/interleukin-1 receptor domain-containing protein, partial [Xanthobacteraceae bacterium]